ncbi:hypothetical protein A6R68_17763, partial [Neotoma lepida]
ENTKWEMTQVQQEGLEDPGPGLRRLWWLSLEDSATVLGDRAVVMVLVEAAAVVKATGLVKGSVLCTSISAVKLTQARQGYRERPEVALFAVAAALLAAI